MASHWIFLCRSLKRLKSALETFGSDAQASSIMECRLQSPGIGPVLAISAATEDIKEKAMPWNLLPVGLANLPLGFREKPTSPTAPSSSHTRSGQPSSQLPSNSWESEHNEERRTEQEHSDASPPHAPDLCCWMISDSLSKSWFLHIQKPANDFSSSDLSRCFLNACQFLALTVSLSKESHRLVVH